MRAGACLGSSCVAVEWPGLRSGWIKAAEKLPDKAHDAAAFATGRRVHTRSRLGFCGRCRVGPFLLIGQKRSAQSQSGGAVSIGHEAEVSNAMEALRQGVQQEATKELVGRQLHDLCRVVVSVIFPGGSVQYLSHI